MEDTVKVRRAIQFRQVDPIRSRARTYHVSEARTLFGGLGLVITWGRIGRRPNVRFESFGSRAALEARWQELVQRRLAHGYELVGAKASARRRAA